MNKLIISALSILFCLTTKVNFAQLFPVSKVNAEYQLLYGFINSTGEIIVPVEYTKTFEFSDSMGMVVGAESKIGYVNALGKHIIPCMYDKGFAFQNGYALAQIDQKGFVLDKSGKQYLIKNLDFSSDNYYSEGLVIVENKKKLKGYANLKNELVIPCQYEKATPFSEGYAIVKKDGKFHLLDVAGSSKELDYTNAASMTNGLICVQSNYDRWGAIDANLQEIINCDYASLYSFKNGYAPFKEFYEMGLMNKKGEVILPPDYYAVYPFSENRIIVQRNDSTATLLDENFNVVIEFPNVWRLNTQHLIFQNGLCKIYLVEGPKGESSIDSVQQYGGITPSYIDKEGQIVWQEETFPFDE